MNLRPYQERIVRQALDLLQSDRSVLIEMATGTGKTLVGSTLAQRMPLGRVLWVAHRIELVNQAATALVEATGEPVGFEIPGRWGGECRIAVASRDTIAHRLPILAQRGYSLLVIDEAHHAPTYRYESIIEALPDAYRIGLTATPDRSDKKNVRKHFRAATTPYDIPTAINDAWLVPFKAQRVRVASVDLSKVRATSKDFLQDELDAVMSAQASIDGMAQGILKYQGSRPTLVFCSSIGAAMSMSERLPGARIILGDSEPNDRLWTLRNFGTAYQTLVSVGVLTEGVDLPSAACVAMCRPTKSRSFYVQMLGRTGRPLPGLDAASDYAPNIGYLPSERRREWIADSAKPYALVLDFVGVCGKHSVITPADVLGGSAEAKRRVKRQIEAGVRMIDVAAALAQEESRIARRNAEAEAKDREWALRQGIELPPVKVTAEEIGIVGIDGKRTNDIETTPLPPSQAKKLYLLGLKPSDYETSGEATRAIAKDESLRKEIGLASLKQLELLSRYNQGNPKMKAGVAKGLILQIIRNGWKPIKGRKAT